MSGAEFGMCIIADMLIWRRYYKSPGGEEDGGGAKSGKGRVRMLPQAQLNGSFDQSANRSRIGDCVMLRQIARIVMWPYCAANTQMGIRNFWPYQDPMKGALGRLRPVWCLLRRRRRSLHRSANLGVDVSKKSPAAHPKPDIGAH